MIRVYYARVFSFLKEDTFQFYLNLMEKERREKILKSQDSAGKMRSLTAGVLLRHALCEELLLSFDAGKVFSVGYQEGGKPFLTDYPEVHFNVSHSGDYVCCAVADKPVGIDIQRHTPVREGIAKRFFTLQDNRQLLLCDADQREKMFFRMWSIKESYIKLTGKGIGQGLDSFEIDWKMKAVFEKNSESAAAFFEEQNCLQGYSFCVCYRIPGETVEWKERLCG